MPGILKRHIESKHEGIIHFSCEFMNCAYFTDDNRSFKEHKGAHNSLFKCQNCGKDFARPISLKQHMKSVHEGVHFLRCQFFQCKFETNHKQDMREHALKHSEQGPGKRMKVEDIKGDTAHEENK